MISKFSTTTVSNELFCKMLASKFQYNFLKIKCKEKFLNYLEIVKNNFISSEQIFVPTNSLA